MGEQASISLHQMMDIQECEDRERDLDYYHRLRDFHKANPLSPSPDLLLEEIGAVDRVFKKFF